MRSSSGAPGNVRYATGARQLWRTGANPFAPLCVVIPKTRRIHLLSTWDDGIPPEIGHDDLYGMFWNPANLIAALAGIPGLAEAHRVGTDSLTPFFAEVLAGIVPDFELVDASGILAGLRADKTADELACIEVAVTLAEAGLAALEEALRPGVSERDLLGVYVETLAALGAPTPPSESVVFATPRRGPVHYRSLASDRIITRGELVVLSPGALYAAYEGGVARTRTAGCTSLRRGPSPWPIAATGPSMRSWRHAVRATRAPTSTVPGSRPASAPAEIALAYGMGIGTETPMVGFGRSAGTTLHAGAVLSVQAWVSEEGIGGFFEREMLRIGPDGPALLTRSAK